VIVPEREKAFITLLGTIHRPGQYEILGKLNLSSALAMAGGHIEGSQIAKVQVLRTTGEKHESFIYDMNKIMSGKAEDPEILAGDTIMVNEKKPGRNILQILGSLSPFFWLFRR
jgi:protein involved in polysaccharide export with SLBB domain